MDFSEALKLLKQGKSLNRSSWSDTLLVIRLPFGSAEPDIIEMVPYRGSTRLWVPTTKDLLADDWEELHLD